MPCPRERKKKMEIVAIILTIAFVLGLLYIYFMYVTSPKKTGFSQKGTTERVDLSVIPIKWQEVSAMMKMGGPANFKQSIMDADKLVDLALKSKVSGDTMGDRLKNAQNLFDRNTYNNLWTAHKIRNKLAHEADFEGLSSDATLAVRYFEKALKELRVI